ncbi:MAG: molybdenum cofactor guanylyltransferase [Cyanophyceae cyanobacterium]
MFKDFLSPPAKSLPGSPLNVIILAGGKSRRMGQDKALIQWQGATFLERCARVAFAVGDRCTVVTPWAERYQAALPVDLVAHIYWCPDPVPGSGPPLAIAQLLTLAPAVDHPWTLVLACDLPKLDPQLLLTWGSHLDDLAPEVLAYVPRWGDRWEPLCGFYRPQAGESLGRFLEAGGRSLQRWLETSYLSRPCIAQPITLTLEEHSTLHNCNVPSDLDIQH